jgi:cadmium resistance protein CadD (predicted permease)
MKAFAAQISLAVVAFASTDTDDLFVLIGFFADPKFKARHVVAGQYLGIAALYTVSVIGSLVSLIVPAAYIGLLGLAPIAIGANKLWDQWRGDETEADPKNHEAVARRGAIGKVLAVAAVTTANGGDNIGVYTPLFAMRTAEELAVFGIVFVLMTALWCFAAHWLVHHRTVGAPIRRYAHRIVPFVLIALGMLILYQAGIHKLLLG